MMREQVGLERYQPAKLDRSAVRQRQLIDDRKTSGIAQRSVTRSSQLQRRFHGGSLATQDLLSQYIVN